MAEDPDPLSAAAAAAAAAGSPEVAAMKAAADRTTDLLKRVYGPPADALGDYFGERVKLWAQRKLTLARIAQRTRDKVGGDLDGAGIVNPRVSSRVLEDGSYADDEVVVDYWSGVLAGARSPDGRDDRAIWWSNQISGMSTLQIRLHYLLYREWAARLRNTDLNLGDSPDRLRAQMYVDANELWSVLSRGMGVEREGRSVLPFSPDAGWVHALTGLAANDLIGVDWHSGAPDRDDVPLEFALRVVPRLGGLELYCWAQGLPGPDPTEFTKVAEPFDVEPPLPGLTRAYLPKLYAKAD